MRSALTLVGAAVVLLTSSQAHAADPAAAQALFDEGKRLVASQQYAQACPKFEESQRLDPGLGTLFHLADCEAHTGKTATAWATFLEVASEAKAQGEGARESGANARAAALEHDLARLEIDPGAESRTPELRIFRDGMLMGRAQWSTAVPVDPGAHVIEARAPGKGTWSTTVTVVAAAREMVTVPLLADAPAGAVATNGAASTTVTSSGDVDARQRGRGQRTAGIVLSAVGVAALGVGGYFGAVSLKRHDDAQAHCTNAGCDSSGVGLRDDARRAGDAATVALVAGGALVVTGIITYVTAPHSAPFAPATASTRPTISVSPAGAFLQGAF